LAASSRELAFRLLHIRRPGAGIRRLFTPGRKVGGLFEKARGDIRIRRGHCKFEKGCRLFCQIFLARHNLVPRYYTRYYPPLPVRLRTAAESVPGEKYKSELKARRARAIGRSAADGPRGVRTQPGAPPVAASVLAQEFSGLLVDEMQPGAGEADDGRIGIGIGLAFRRGFRKPMLHVRAQPGTFEEDMPAHTGEYAELARRVTSVCLRSLGPWPGRKALRLGQLKRRLCLPVLAEASTFQKEHIANIEQTWYEIPVRRRILNLPPPVCPARESPP
jgi:hypothetical protein